MSELVKKFQQYSGWRANVLAALERYRTEVFACSPRDAASEQRFARIKTRLAEDHMSIAFVAEFSRGKSELINAIFFADYGQRLLPSSAGRTTMCPTELLYDETFPPSIRLLPIETRANAGSTSEFKEQGHIWTVLPLEIGSGHGMLEAFKQVSLTKRVSIEDAKNYGLYHEGDPDASLLVDAEGLVEISYWRHAVINFPHPLLKQGLVIIDTPGLNAIGSEPELTLNLIPSAHAVLFILAADTGVTRSDIEVWRNHIGTGPARLVVLNKIDSMWDELRSGDEVDQQIAGQVSSTAQTLGVAREQVFPISAQKGLVGKINSDGDLLNRSRLPLLEAALSAALICGKQDMVRRQLLANIDDLLNEKQALLSARVRHIIEQLAELRSLRGKNQNMIEHMMKRVDFERREFDSSVMKLQGTRAVFTRLSMEVFTSLSMESLKEEIHRTRIAMAESRFSVGMLSAVREFLANVRRNLDFSAGKTEEITTMMTVMYRKFSTEDGLTLSAPMPFSLKKYHDELRMVEDVYQKQFGAGAILTTSRKTLMTRFFDAIASQVKQSLLQANRDVEAWLRMIMIPLEGQIWEHRQQLKKRRQSIERIHAAAESLEEKMQALENLQAETEQQKNTLLALAAELRSAINRDLETIRVAA